MAVLEVRGCNVTFSRYPSTQGVVAGNEVRAWGGDAKVRFLDVERVHHLEVLRFRPRGDLNDAIRMCDSLRDAVLSVFLGDKVRMDVDFVAKRHCLIPRSAALEAQGRVSLDKVCY